MAFITNYTFENSSRIGNDLCYQDQETIQNINACNYTLQNYFASDCLMSKAINLATSQPYVFYNGSSSVGDGGCVVDDSSKLLIGQIQTHPKCKIDLFHRPFATVPYLGKGSVCPILESQIMQGELLTNRRSVNHITEKCFLKYSNTPLLVNVQDRITNPAYCVEEASHPKWIRGGIPSRELNRDQGKCQ